MTTINMANIEALWNGAVKVNARASMGQKIVIDAEYADTLSSFVLDITGLLYAQQGPRIITDGERSLEKAKFELARRKEPEPREEYQALCAELAQAMNDLSESLQTFITKHSKDQAKCPETVRTTR